MDLALRCNSLNCRRRLDDCAVVTTCSHIFCVPCSDSLGLAGKNGTSRVCPACQTQLTNPDDAVVTQLNPTEDYKTSVLSGLSPTVIMECAGRGLAFYTYQTTQEIVYQEFLTRSLTDKYSALSAQMDKVIHDANTEISSNREKITVRDDHIRSLEHKNNELANALRQKAKSLQQMRKLYEALKQQQVAAGMEMAADYDAEDVLRAAAGGGVRRSDSYGSLGRKSNGSGEIRLKSSLNPWQTQEQYPSRDIAGQHPSLRRSTNNVWDRQVRGDNQARVQSFLVPKIPPPTPSQHRTRLHDAIGATGTNSVIETLRHQGTPARPAPSPIDANMYRGGANGGCGLAAAAKMGRQQGGAVYSRQANLRPLGSGNLIRR
ncbi:Hypothetical protein R9X50_00735900 [Acrodontium crateriforme]|uniref:RING-type domain-containing protein n=1 Tax=Acrodontium crateriforme TaxID=150365 RepID=A0AAQ3RE42_9PEZI|nr:Hypothetical protein R9X50_00735900 [Acrodontium crateriforme]